MYALSDFQGKIAHSLGIAGKTPQATIPRVQPAYVTVTPGNKKLELLLTVSSFHIMNGGIWQSIIIGEKSQIVNNRKKNRILDLLMIGGTTIMIVFSFSIYLFRRKETISLAFSCFCFAILIRCTLTSERLFADIFPEVSWQILHKIEFLSLPGLLIASFVYTKSLFPKEISSSILKGVKWICLVYGLFIIFTPSTLYAFSMVYFQIVIILGSLYLLFGLLKAAKNHQLGSIVFIACFVVFLLFVINDILYSNSLILTGFYLQISVLIFVIFQSFIMSMRFTKGLTLIEKMTNDLVHANQRINDEVNERQKTEQEKNELRDKLENSLTKVISGFIPICSKCKKIRDGEKNWSGIEQYVEQHSEAKFSHGLCPECAENIYPGIMDKLKKKGKI